MQSFNHLHNLAGASHHLQFKNVETGQLQLRRSNTCDQLSVTRSHSLEHAVCLSTSQILNFTCTEYGVQSGGCVNDFNLLDLFYSRRLVVTADIVRERLSSAEL
jgi:hypothetical protein